MFDRKYGERRLYQLRTLLRAMDEGETVALLAYEAENEAIAVSVVAQLLDTDFETARICLEAGAIRYHAESRAKPFGGDRGTESGLRIGPAGPGRS